MATLQHIDTCLPSFLNDHHNREGELLLGTPVDGHTRNATVKALLKDEFSAVNREDAPSYAEFVDALEECFKGVDLRKSFDRTLGADSGETDDCVYAYFLLTWDIKE